MRFFVRLLIQLADDTVFPNNGCTCRDVFCHHSSGTDLCIIADPNSADKNRPGANVHVVTEHRSAMFDGRFFIRTQGNVVEDSTTLANT